MIERHFIQEQLKKLKLEQYLAPELRSAGFVGVDVIKTPIATRVIINVTKPGLAIGKKGKTIKNLTKELEEKFGYENPQIEVQEVKEPELNAKACVDRIVTLIERGYSWRSVVYRVMEDAIAHKAQGIEIVLRGVLAGKGNRAKHERVAKGYMKKAGEQAYLVDYAKGMAVTKIGGIGVKVRIIKPGIVFPDKRSINEILGRTEVKEEKKGAEGESKAGRAEGEEKEAEEKSKASEAEEGEKIKEEAGREKIAHEVEAKAEATKEKNVNESLSESPAEGNEKLTDAQKIVPKAKKVKKEEKNAKIGKATKEVTKEKAANEKENNLEKEGKKESNKEDKAEDYKEASESSKNIG